MKVINQDKINEILEKMNSIPSNHLASELNRRQDKGEIELYIDGSDSKLYIRIKECKNPCPVHCKNN
jgi:hemolysin activation/secretion protein